MSVCILSLFLSLSLSLTLLFILFYFYFLFIFHDKRLSGYTIKTLLFLFSLKVLLYSFMFGTSPISIYDFIRNNTS